MRIPGFLLKWALGWLIEEGLKLLKGKMGVPIIIHFGKTAAEARLMDVHPMTLITKAGAIAVKVQDHVIGSDEGKELRLLTFVVKQ